MQPYYPSFIKVYHLHYEDVSPFVSKRKSSIIKLYKLNISKRILSLIKPSYLYYLRVTLAQKRRTTFSIKEYLLDYQAVSAFLSKGISCIQQSRIIFFIKVYITHKKGVSSSLPSVILRSQRSTDLSKQAYLRVKSALDSSHNPKQPLLFDLLSYHSFIPVVILRNGQSNPPNEHIGSQFDQFPRQSLLGGISFRQPEFGGLSECRLQFCLQLTLVLLMTAILQSSSKMNFAQSSEIQTHLLKEELIPNFNLLDHHVQSQIVNILQTIIAHPDKRTIQQFSRLGLLEEAPLLRSHIWKLLLETLSVDPKTWAATKKTNNELYRTLVDKFIGRYADEEDLLSIREEFDSNLWGEIQLDTRRTHSAFNFYQKQIDHTQIYLKRPTKNSDVLSRILYIWGKINSTVRYVQGMNQILAPIYYLQFQKYTPFAESEVFFMFSSLMTFLIDMHIKDMDETEQGIMGRMRILNKYLKVVDFQLWNKLDREKILPQYYSFRWLALLLAQEFGLYETMKLWDVMLSFDGYKRYFYLYCCCISILKFRKQTILHQDFISILPAIQKLRDVNVGKIIDIANKLYEKYSKVNIEKLYLRMNEQIDKQREEERAKKEEEKKGKWDYSTVFEKTGNLLYKMVGNFKK